MWSYNCLNTVPFNCKQYLLSGAKPIMIPQFKTLLLRSMIPNSGVPSHTSHNSCQLEYLTSTFTWLRKLTATLGHRPIPFHRNVLCSLYCAFKDTACVRNFRDIQQQLSAYKSIRAITEDMPRVEIKWINSLRKHISYQKLFRCIGTSIV